MRDGDSQVQAHQVNRTVKYEDGAIFVWDCMTFRGMGYMCKIEGQVTHTLYLGILQDGAMKTI